METTRELTDAATIAERVSRTLMAAASIPEFEPGSVPVSEAAKVFGKDPCWVRAGIINGWLPIGNATIAGEKVKDINQKVEGKKMNFYISPKLLWEMTGYVWRGTV